MGGSLLQLIAKGPQDDYLTVNPDISYFKTVYRRPTHFSIEPIPCYFTGETNFGNLISCQIPRKGDLINRIWLEIELPESNNDWYWVPYPGLRLIKEIWIEIGGQVIHKLYSDWLYIWNELTLSIGKKERWNECIGSSNISSSCSKLMIPIPFWFSKENVI